ncbi:DUF3750 domain-containing protein [Lutibaculum baratangense]|uniref:DUF3750 domain-containing protein n=1 Tax=Lutibaculum baratangense AMV1 TaxID=631454 RepID=V4RD51_9HYPH|nr:DUF3750 domain-containing protein [Lutibaculum baratangense]ESR23319.1 hypothetical protein N177_3387 [Lutibaculum baratangense AMV1]
MRRLRTPLIALVFVFFVPVWVKAGVWYMSERPASWREANWSSAGLLPAAAEEPEASIRVMYARTGGLKGVVAVHSWIVLKEEGAPRYERYDVMGWGDPVRRDHRAADGYWYSHSPEVAVELKGEAAQRLIPRVRAAIAEYRWSARGSYRVWPGPNSNTFVATILHEVPELGGRLPPTAIGRDYLGDGFVSTRLPTGGWMATYRGILGIAAGPREGLEITVLGLVAGVRFQDPALIIPGFGVLGGSEAIGVGAEPEERAADAAGSGGEGWLFDRSRMTTLEGEPTAAAGRI